MTGSGIHLHEGVLLGGNWAKNVSATTNATTIYQAATLNTTNSVITQLKFLAAKSVRTSTIVLAAFNALAAFATVVAIYRECRFQSRKNLQEKERLVSARPKGSIGSVANFMGRETKWWNCVHGPYVLPFTLSWAIMVQSIMFAVLQSQGMEGLFRKECAPLSHTMWLGKSSDTALLPLLRQ
jgi:hypothetical protein